MSASNPVAATIRFEIIRWLRDPIVWAGLAAFLIMVALGILQHRNSLPPRPTPANAFGYAYIVFALLVTHAGIARDRSERFDSLLTANFLSAREMFIARVSSLLAIIAAAFVLTLVLGVVISVGDLRFALWYTTLFTTYALVFIPAILAVEIALNTRYPIAIILLLFIVTSMTFRYFGMVHAMDKIIPVTVRSYDYAALGKLGLRVIPAIVLTLLLYPLYRWRIGAPRSRDLPM